ncbi:CYTH domain-containing protein [Shewanella sp. OMA3-2]|uniref:CYTH domain-containing protein n=1 Tax=Shewanella sp. OMA3-2 TaxID=2908650 RepID=UPI001F4167F8|nr:CYTH domain-containing protein [Shewanella sp. OMA3-2]UJF22362.1 CYTH domain-containing protein [Shewanella sp. OMA3-2]
MTVEIERKYLVHNDQFKSLSHRSSRIVQGYLNSEKSRTVRVRIMGDQGFLTIKGMSNQARLSRFEWEKEISVPEAQDLLNLCEQGVIDKTRYLVEYQNQVFEVDEFYGENQGLIVAELELESEQQIVIKPDWLGDEVTGDNRYYNSSLMKQPYSQWV